MKVIDILNQDKVTLSFEVFPPKTSTRYESVAASAEAIAQLHPDYMSVTYGAGGGTSAYTSRLARDIQNNEGVPVISHLTCVSSTRDKVREEIETYKKYGIENILALRGDIPEGGAPHHDYTHACELIREIKSQGDFCIGAACYPEVHPESHNYREDIRYLKEKVDAGCDYLTTQMFFDNAMYFNFMYRVRDAGINVPIVAGIMPITRAVQVDRAIQLSGCSVPQRFRQLVDRFGDHPESMKQAGIIYASEQIIDLVSSGINHIHVYSMNNPDVARGIYNNVSEIIK